MNKSQYLHLNKTDIKNQLRAALKWSAPVLLMYITSVIGAIQVPGHNIGLNDFIPTTLTIGGIVAWLLMQAQGLLIKLTDGPRT